MQDVSVTIESLAAEAEALPLSSQQAFSFTTNYAAKYLNSHTFAGLTPDKAAILAAGRLGWLLAPALKSLSGIFTAGEAANLMDCYSGTLFFPDQLLDMPSDVFEHLGDDLADEGEEDEENVPPEVAKLRKLTPLQRLALADALEQAWHRGYKADKNWEGVFAELGIKLL